jgi:hypothetical protein
LVGTNGKEENIKLKYYHGIRREKQETRSSDLEKYLKERLRKTHRVLLRRRLI